jgi:hypothetical protein
MKPFQTPGITSLGEHEQLVIEYRRAAQACFPLNPRRDDHDDADTSHRSSHQ